MNGGAEIPTWLLDTTYLLPMVVFLGGALGFGLRRLKKTIVEEIKTATAPIQPKSNGGLSMTDLHTKVDSVIHTVNDIQAKAVVDRAVIDALVIAQAAHRTESHR